VQSLTETLCGAFYYNFSMRLAKVSYEKVILFHVFHVCALKDVLCFMINQQMHICTYVQSLIISLHQHLLVTPMTITRVLYNRNTSNIRIIVQTV